MNIMRSSYKKMAESHGDAMQKHTGQLIDDAWEVMSICSQRIAHCLRMDRVGNNKQTLSLLLILWNMISDCCCCMDALERGHERTVFNNIRMILEDFGRIVHAKNAPAILESLLAGKYNASDSITFLRVNYPTHEFHKTYGKLSKISHHNMQELVLRQCIDQDRRVAHLKPFDPNRHEDMEHKLEAVLMIIHLVRMAAEEAESLCFDQLDQPYFWLNQTTPNRTTPIDVIITKIAATVDNLMDAKKSPSLAEENARSSSPI